MTWPAKPTALDLIIIITAAIAVAMILMYAPKGD
jgi:hypothetical protein